MKKSVDARAKSSMKSPTLVHLRKIVLILSYYFRLYLYFESIPSAVKINVFSKCFYNCSNKAQLTILTLQYSN